MTLSNYILAILIGAFLIGISTAVVVAKSDKEEDQEVASSDCTILAALTDPEMMAATMADPAKSMAFMTLMNSPQSAQAMMECSMDSNQWTGLMANMSNPAKMMNAMSQFMNPQMYMNWMTASMNPQTYQSSMNTFMNPAMYMQWMTASINPAFYQSSMNKTMDSKWQQESSAWMMNPNNFTQMFGSFFQAPVVADATDAK